MPSRHPSRPADAPSIASETECHAPKGILATLCQSGARLHRRPVDGEGSLPPSSVYWKYTVPQCGTLLPKDAPPL